MFSVAPEKGATGAPLADYPYKRSHLIAMRVTKITASDPHSTLWPGER
jgi:hypothetical protein